MDYSTAILHYEPAQFPFARIAAEHLGDLRSLHDPTIGRLQVGRERTHYHEQLYAIGEPFLAVYRAFVKHLLGTDAPDYLYQRIPSFRVHLPGNVATGNFHRDSDFGHQAAELNYLVPLTPMRNTSSVWVESEPDKGDYAPVSMVVGDYLRFHGALLRHGSVPNDTGYTRVSFDFRVLPKAAYRDEGKASAQLGVRFTLGEYYADGSEL